MALAFGEHGYTPTLTNAFEVEASESGRDAYVAGPPAAMHSEDRDRWQLVVAKAFYCAQN